MKRYLFFVNQPYSYSILRPLQEEILRRGDEVAWFLAGCTSEPLQSSEKRLHTLLEVKEYNPIAVFVPGDWVPPFFPGIKVEVFHGLARNKRGHNSEDESDHYRIRGWFDLYCTHAEKDTEKFSALARKHGFFHVKKTGWPKLDPLFRDKVLDRSVDGGKAASSETPIVFFASTFSQSVTCAPTVADAIQALVESGRWRFIVTLHPKMDSTTVERYRSMVGPGFRFVESHEDLLPILPQADVMLCDTSSIMFEFMFLDKPVVTFRTKMPGPYLIDVHSTADIEQALTTALSKPEPLMNAMKELCDDLHPDRDGFASSRVLEAVDEFETKNGVGLKSKPLNLLRKIKVRSRFRKEMRKQEALDSGAKH